MSPYFLNWAAYVALFGIRRGVVKLDAMALKTSFSCTSGCWLSWQVLFDPLWVQSE